MDCYLIAYVIFVNPNANVSISAESWITELLQTMLVAFRHKALEQQFGDDMFGLR